MNNFFFVTLALGFSYREIAVKLAGDLAEASPVGCSSWRQTHPTGFASVPMFEAGFTVGLAYSMPQ
jgi:hypothetical protein